MKVNKILIVIYVAITIIVAYFAYGIVKNRYFTSPGEENTPSFWEKFYQKDEGEEIDASSSQNEVGEEDFNDEDSEDDNTLEDDEEGDEFLEVTSEDCNNECEEFEEGADKKYCREICGLEKKSSTVDSCDKLGGLEKDYCWKDMAIQDVSFEICQKIKDENIKKSCQNRIVEELLNGQ